MNALQYWIIDSFIKDPEHGSGSGTEGRYGVIGDEDSEDEDDEEWLERQRRRREAGILRLTEQVAASRPGRSRLIVCFDCCIRIFIRTCLLSTSHGDSGI